MLISESMYIYCNHQQRLWSISGKDSISLIFMKGKCPSLLCHNIFTLKAWNIWETKTGDWILFLATTFCTIGCEQLFNLNMLYIVECWWHCVFTITWESRKRLISECTSTWNVSRNFWNIRRNIFGIRIVVVLQTFGTKKVESIFSSNLQRLLHWRGLQNAWSFSERYYTINMDLETQ